MNRQYGLARLLAVTIVARVLFVLITKGAGSGDLDAWVVVANLLAQGRNPYVETVFLSWGPLWMEIVFGLSKVATAIGLDLKLVIRLFLGLAELGLVAVVYRFVERRHGERTAFRVLLFGVALNPVGLTQIVVHANFDVLVGLLSALSIVALLRYEAEREPASLIESSLWLGLGILLKTVPIVLFPLLLVCMRGARAKTVLLCLLCAFGPELLGLTTLFLVSPPIVVTKVLNYRSIGGYFGISGIMALAGSHDTASAVLAFRISMLACLVAVAVGVKRKGLSAAILLGAPLLLLAIPTFGPGYGPQYAYWCLPLLLMAFPASWTSVRWAIVVLGVVACPTYLIEYAVLPTHGAFARWMLAPTTLDAIVKVVATQRRATLLRMPLFLACVATVIALQRQLVLDVRRDDPAAAP